MAAVIPFQTSRNIVMPSLTSWSARPQTQRHHELVDAAESAGIKLTPTQFADALFSLYVQAGIVPPPARDEPPASVVRGVATGLLHTAIEADDKRASAALRKALTDFNRGTRPLMVPGGWLVPSATKTNVLYRVGSDDRCKCEAGQRLLICRHAALIEITKVARERWCALLETLTSGQEV